MYWRVGLPSFCLAGDILPGARWPRGCGFVPRARDEVIPVSGTLSLGHGVNRATFPHFQHGCLTGTTCSWTHLQERCGNRLFSALCNLTTLDLTPFLELESFTVWVVVSTRLVPLCDCMLELTDWKTLWSHYCRSLTYGGWSRQIYVNFSSICCFWPNFKGSEMPSRYRNLAKTGRNNMAVVLQIQQRMWSLNFILNVAITRTSVNKIEIFTFILTKTDI